MTETWLICEVTGQFFAIPVSCVDELLSLGGLRITPIQNTPKHVVGAINVRGRTLWVLDIRTMLGRESLNAERDRYLDTLRLREEDHINWINELVASVDEGREFTLATDPHKCGFGKWYDNLRGDPVALRRFANDQLALLDIVERFDQPHQRIHQVAISVKKLVDGGKVQEAKALIEEAKDTELKELIELFGQSRELLTDMRRGVIVVVEHDGQHFGLLVDNSCDVKEFAPEAHQIHSMAEKSGAAPIDLIRDEAADQLIQVMDINRLLPKSRQAQPA